MSMNKVLAVSNKPGEVTLKGFRYLKDRYPDDFVVCLIVEKNGHLSAGCWDTIEPDDVLAWLPIEEAAIDVNGLWWNPEYRLISVFLECVMIFAKDADDCLKIEYSGGDEGKISFRMDVKTGNILENDENDLDEICYLKSTLRAWYDHFKEKLLKDYQSGRYSVLPKWE